MSVVGNRVTEQHTQPRKESPATGHSPGGERMRGRNESTKGGHKSPLSPEPPRLWEGLRRKSKGGRKIEGRIKL